MKRITLIFLIFSCVACYSMNIEVSVFYNLNEVQDYELYAKESDGCVIDIKHNGKLFELIKDKEGNSRIELLLKYKNSIYLIPIFPKDIYNSLELYIDNRWISNKTKKKFKVRRTKYLFKKVCYAFLSGSHSIIIGTHKREIPEACKF